MPFRRKAAKPPKRKNPEREKLMNRFNIVKYTAFSLEILLCFILQSIPAFTLEIFGGRPVLMLPIALTIAIFEGEIPSITFGVAAGLLADSGYSGPVGYYAIMLAISCYVISILMENYIRTNLLTAVIIGIVSIPVIIVGQFFFFYVLMGYGNELNYFLSHYLSRIIYTFAFIPVFYGINRFIASKTTQE